MAESTDPMAGIMHKLTGDIKGKLLMLFPWQSAFNLVNLGVKKPATTKVTKFNDGEQALLKSAGTIMGSAYSNAIKQLLHLEIKTSAPQLIFEPKASMIKVLKEELSETSEYFFNMQTEFKITESNIKWYFLLVPDMDSLKKILKKLGTLS
jgi:chemotaxis protein CheC